MLLDDDLLRRALDPPSPGWTSEEGFRDAAVLVPVVARAGGDALVLNRRRDDLHWHAGQVCFPGGARHGDEPATACAVRESCEEMGLEPQQITILGRLPDRISIAGFRVAAFAGRLAPDALWTIRESEVAEAFEVPCEHLLEPARWSFRATTHPRARLPRIPYFEAGPHVVWGFTGIVLRDFVRRALEFDPRDDEDGVSAPAGSP